MSRSHPTSVSEWRAYLGDLEGEALRNQAVAANAVAFVQRLLAEGYSAAQVEAVLSAFADRFADLGLHPPGGGLYDLAGLKAAKAGPIL